MSYKIIKLFLLIALSFLLATACNSLEVQPRHILREHATEAECRVIEHNLEKTCIPLAPQRIITSDSWLLDPLFALGIEESIVGTGCPSWGWVEKDCVAPSLPSKQQKYLEDMEKVGSYPPSLEKILFLEPDLILGLDIDKSLYERLSDIAPTVQINLHDFKSSFKAYLRHLAKLFNREEVAEEIFIKYENRIAEVRKQLNDRLKNAEVSVVIYGCGGGDELFIPPRSTIWFQILDDLGIKVKPLFSRSEDYMCGRVNSIETIHKYDADILFIANFHSKSGAFLLEKPLIAALDAVKNGHAYVINGQDVWDVYGPSGVNRLLDVLSNCLLEAAQTF